MKCFPAVLGSLAFAVAAMGCAQKKNIKTDEVPRAVATPQAEVAAKEATSAHYIVRKGDNLWKIASRSDVLGDSFHWPLLYKQNRDQIEDPDLIEVRQDLNYGEKMSDQQIAEAVQKAKETPPYVPHTQVRKSLPVKY